MRFEVLIDGRLHEVEIEGTTQGLVCKIDGEPCIVDVAATSRDVLSIIHEGRSYEARRERSTTGDTHIRIGHERFRSEVRDPRSFRNRRGPLAAEAGSLAIYAPMPGKVIRVLVAQGDEVEAGQALVVVEAMKMQNEIRASKKGKVIRIAVQQGSPVNAGDLLAEIE